MRYPPSSLNRYLGWGVFLALVAYSLPWVVNAGVSLTLNGYDLAEWTSLHPDARAGALVTTLLLRLQPCLIAILVALTAQNPFKTLSWWFKCLLVVLIAVALLPPLEFFTIAGEDVNHRQQFFLALSTLIAGSVGLSGVLPAVRWVVMIAGAGMGIVTSAIGLSQAYALMQQFHLSTQIGAGCLTLIIVYIALAFYMGTQNKRGSP